MPTKKRKPRKSFIFGKRKKTTEAPSKPKATEQPKRKSSNFKKRTTRPYVYMDGGILVVRTPSATTKWDMEFRKRIVGNYVAPRTMLTRSNFEKNYIENGQQDREYRVDGKTVMVKQRYHEISGAYVILSTDVIDVAAGARLFLNHPEAAMRILMVYTFLRETKISGVPDLDIAPWEP